MKRKEHGNAPDEKSPECRRKKRREKVGSIVSARKLGATLWRMQLVGPENNGGDEKMKKNKKKIKENEEEEENKLGFKVCFNSLFEIQDLNFKVCSFLLVLHSKKNMLKSFFYKKIDLFVNFLVI